VFGTAAAALLVLGVILFATRGGDASDVAAGGPAPAPASESASDLWVDAGLWGGIALINMERQELLSLVPGQGVSRPVVGTNGVWAIEYRAGNDGPPSVRTLDPTTGSTLNSFEFPDQDARSSCQLVAGEDLWATCTSDANRLREDPEDRESNPSVTLYRLTADGPEPVLTRDGKLAFGSAHKSTVWLVIEEGDFSSEVGALIVRVDGQNESSVRLPAGSQRPTTVLATTDGLWLVDGRAANVVDVDGPELVPSKPQVWNRARNEAATFAVGSAVPYDGGIAFLAEMGEEPFLVAVHLRVGTDPVTAEVPFRYETTGLSPVLAITDSGRWWTLGEPLRAEGTVTPSEEFTLVGIDFPAATTADEISFPGRGGPFADPALQAVGNDLVVLAELPESDISAVIVDGDTGQTRATIPLQQRSLLPLVGPDDQVVVADLWTSSVWIAGTRSNANAARGSNIPDPPVAVPNGFAVTSRQSGGGGLHSWDGELTGDITVDGELFSDGVALWYENSEAAGVIDTSTGRATPVTTGSGGVSIFSGTRALVRNVAVIDGDFWRIGEGVVERARSDGTVSSVVIPASSGTWAIARSPSGSVAAMDGADLHLIDPATEQITATAKIDPTSPSSDLPAGYLVSDDVSLWWVALYDGFAIQLDPATGEALQRVDELGDGIATAAVSSGALVVAHENSGTLTRVGPDGERVTREVGPRPYWVSANDDRVVVGLQGERAVAEFDSAALTERRRIPLGPPGPDS